MFKQGNFIFIRMLDWTNTLKWDERGGRGGVSVNTNIKIENKHQTHCVQSIQGFVNALLHILDTIFDNFQKKNRIAALLMKAFSYRQLIGV